MSRLKDTWAVFLHYRPLLRHLAMRDIKVKYRRSKLGIVWSVLNPLLMMAVQAVVFGSLFGQDNRTFMVYLITGQVLFNFFSDATNMGMDSVLGAAGLIKKVYIPKYIFPLEKVLFSLINVSFSYIAMFLVIIVSGILRGDGLGLSAWALLFPVPLMIMFVFNFGIALILSSATVYFRDIKHFYGVFVTALNYLTPIFYPADTLTDIGRNPFLRFIVQANPLFWFVKFNRSILYEKMAPGLLEVLIPSIWAVVLVSFGLWMFKKTQDNFILHI